MSQHNYTRALSDGAWDVNLGTLSKEIETALPGKMFTVNASDTDVVVDATDQLTAGEITTLDTAVTDHKAASPAAILAAAKIEKSACVDKRTGELIAAGFTYSAKQFSLSLSAQMKMTGVHQIKDDAAVVYPVVWNNIDDTDTHSVADAADLDAFFLTGVGTLRAHLDSGTTLKVAVTAAVDLAAVAAVVDNR